ncbi:DUF6502 family protein [Marinicella rhabdoformis]|uniref:DUF6502 family protein n=1 Tax=Marinicella rhabdoformis TaxID=2580566 RepID=UPI0012AEB827|nr:DUF6502 family protein [Marinicella rhabdoformis]
MSNKLSPNQKLSFSPKWMKFISISLRPVIRLLIKNKVEFKTFLNICRDLYVKEAESYIYETSKDKRGKISSIAYQTGLDRREVSTILKTTKPIEECVIEQNRSREGYILDHWSSDPMFCDDKGFPLPLKRSGSGLSFETLVQRFGKNISHGPILEALLDAQCVEIKKSMVVYKNKNFIPAKQLHDDKIKIVAKSINRLSSTIDHNLTAKEDLFFQRNLYSIRVSHQHHESFKLEVMTMINEHYNNYLIPEFERIESKYETNIKAQQSLPIGLGLFFFNDTIDHEEESS